MSALISLNKMKPAEIENFWDVLKPLLGKMPDPVIADAYGISREWVGQKRQDFGIKAFSRRMKPRAIKIPDDELSNLTVTELNLKYHISPVKIRRLRRAKGILVKKWVRSNLKEVRKTRLKNLKGKDVLNPAEIEKFWKVLKPLLGKIPDTIIADAYGISPERVGQKRGNSRIKAFVPRITIEIPYDELCNLKVTELTLKYHVSPVIIRRLRRAKGIPIGIRTKINIKEAKKAILKKLKEKDVRARDLNNYITQTFGISLGYVRMIRRDMGVKFSTNGFLKKAGSTAYHRK